MLASDPDVSAQVGCGMLSIVYRGEALESHPENTVVWIDQAAKALAVEALPVMVIIEDHAESPDADGRRAFADGINRSAPQMECLAQVILSTGLKGSAFRAICSTIYLLTRYPTQIKVFGTVGEGAAWIRAISEACSVSPQVLLDFIESVRRS